MYIYIMFLGHLEAMPGWKRHPYPTDPAKRGWAAVPLVEVTL